MATLIDAFMIELGLDAAPFEKGQKKAEDAFKKTKDEAVKSGKLIEKSAEATASAIRRVGLEALALFAIFSGSKSLTGFVTNLITADAALGRFSKNMGMAPETIASWGKAAERAGGSAEATATTISALNDSLLDLKVNGNDMPMAFHRLQGLAGMTIDRDHGPTAYINSLSEAIKRASQIDPAKTAFWAKGINIDPATMAVMQRYGSGVGDYVKGFAPSAEQIRQAEEFQAKWVETTQIIENLLKNGFRAMEPALKAILDQMDAWAGKEENIKAIEGALKAFATWMADPQTLQAIKDFASAVGSVAVGITAIVGGVQALSSPRNSEGSLTGRGSYARPHLSEKDAKPGDYYYESDSWLSTVGKKPLDGARALGGPVSGGKHYLVGENGPEIFSPGMSGAITPNGGGAGSAFGGFGGGDTTVDGRPVNRSNPMPVRLEGGGQGGGENWLQTIERWATGGSSGGGGAGGGSGDSGGGGIFGFIGSLLTGGGGGLAGKRGGSERAGADIADKTMQPEAQALLKTIASTESPGYDVLYGGKKFTDFSKHPGVAVPIRSGPNAGRTSSAAGMYQFISSTWNTVSKAIGAKDFSPVNQDRGALYLAQQEYKRKTGRDLMTDLKDPSRITQIGKALRGQWTSLPGGIEQGQNSATFQARYNKNLQEARLRNGGGGSMPQLPLAGARASAPMLGATTNNQSSTNSTNIGKVVVNTQAKDAEGIARSLWDAIKRQGQAVAANYGPK